MVLSLGGLAILLLAIQSTALLVDRASPKEGSATSAALASARTLDQLASELTFATAVARAGLYDLEFTIPDRNGDGLPETIRYTWSGKVGDSLVRTANGVNPANVATPVNEFRFNYDTRTVQVDPTSSEGAETLLVSYDPLLGQLTGSNYTIDANHWIGQYFRPSLPANATAWRVTRVLFQARQHNTASGKALVQLRPALGNLPGSDIIDQTALLESSLDPVYSWRTFYFDNAGGLAPGNGVCLVVQWASDSDAGEVFYKGGLAALAGQSLVTSGNAGSSWSNSNDKQMFFYVYGKIATPNPTGTKDLVTGVRCTLRTSDDTRSYARVSVRLLNEPQAPATGG
jgi:hypothetical protein